MARINNIICYMIFIYWFFLRIAGANLFLNKFVFAGFRRGIFISFLHH